MSEPRCRKCGRAVWKAGICATCRAKTKPMTETTIKITCEECGDEFDSFVLDGTPFSEFRPRFCDPCVDTMRAEYLSQFVPRASNPVPEQFQNYDSTRLKPLAREKLEKLREADYPARLLFTGLTGAGKSYLSAGLAQCYSEGSKRARWVTGAQIKETLKPTDSADHRERNRALIRMCRMSQWLCIDDLGHGNWTTPYAELILEIINARHNLRTIITTQFPPGEWRRHITGDCSKLTIDAITRRLDDYFAIWKL